MGSVGQTDSAPTKKRRGTRIQLKNFPTDMPKDNIEHMLSTFGTLLRSECVSNDGESYISAIYETPEQAQHAVEQLNGHDVHGYKLVVQLFPENFNRNRRPDNQRGYGQQFQNNSQASNVPLKILVPSELVGAVIGKKGVTIKNITTQCKARVDVHGKDNGGLVEKMISIYGTVENCASACKEILKVIHNEPAVVSCGGNLPLKMLVDDRYCGRIIGKEGKIIKKIRDETSTKITISSVQEMAVIYPDRVVSILGSVDGMASACAAVLEKLIECVEKDQQAVPDGVNSMMLMPMMHPMGGGMPYPAVQQPAGFASGYNAGGPPYPSAPAANRSGHGPSNGEMCQIIVPDKSVGAIIGAGGSMIKQIMEDSNAYVTVEPRKEGDAAGSPLERVVTIRGTPDACWKASYFVFEKVKDEAGNLTPAGSGAGDGGEIKLRTMLSVPRSVAGKIIGRQGKTVREIQRMTGAAVKLNEDTTGQKDEVLAEVFGTFMATQGAHARIRALISEDMSDGYAMYPPQVHPQTQLGQQRGPGRRTVQQQQQQQA